MASAPGSVSITRGGGEVVADVAEAAGRGEAGLGVVGDDAARLLAAMLQRMQAEGDEVGGVLDADHAEDAAFLVQLVVVEGQARAGTWLASGGEASPRYIEARCRGDCHRGGAAQTLQLCVSRVVLAGDPLRRVGRAASAAMRCLEAGEDRGAVAVVDLRARRRRRRRRGCRRRARSRPAARRGRCRRGSRAPWSTGPSAEFCTAPASSGVNERDDDQRDREDGGEAGEDRRARSWCR